MIYNLSPTCQIPDLDQIYLKYFGSKKGTFVEVGAFDGESVSNTSCLADAGWKGFYIEPVKEHFEQCVNRHKNNKKIKVSNYAIGTEVGYKPVYCSGIVSTLDKEQADIVSSMHLFGYPQFTESECKQVRLDSYMQMADVPKNFELLVVDVEGREEDVFKSFRLDLWKPKMMIIELVDDHSYFQENVKLITSCQKLREYINTVGYTEVYRDHINTIFVSNDNIISNTNL